MPPAFEARVERADFGRLADGAAVSVYTLTNASGLSVRISDYGGTVLSIYTPNREGDLEDIALGYDTLEAYVAGDSFFGATVGRYANRIAKGRFTLDGQAYTLATNGGPNHIHGGARGFDRAVWNASPFARDGETGLVLRYTSPAGEEGYPGTMAVTVTITLTDDDALMFDYRATTDAPTLANFTNHTYFNLTGTASGAYETVEAILDHRLTVDADFFVPVSPTLIPTGSLRTVAGTPFDFRQARPVGEQIDANDDQIAIASGYDHNYVFAPRRDDNEAMLRFAARLADPSSGRVMEIHTTEPGLQVYSGNFLSGDAPSKGDAGYARWTGIALETQHFPDSPNQPTFPSTVLRPGETYRSQTVYAFGTDAAALPYGR